MSKIENSSLRLDGCVAIITGAGRGMGRCHALMLASRGCKVVVNDIASPSKGSHSDNPALDVVREIEALGGTAVTNGHSVVTEAEGINAGVLNDVPFGQMSAEKWHAIGDVHFRGTVEMCRAAWLPLKQSKAGRIVKNASRL